LLVLRHAKSSWKHADLADHDRPLNGRGKGDAPRMGRLVAERNLAPGLILSSSAVRARETALAVFDACADECELRLLHELYLASPERAIELLSAHAGAYSRVMLVGHNPGMEELVEMLTGKPETIQTGVLAHIELAIASWSEMTSESRGRLLGVWRPREV
jgi:phosphohistidine phosphatase